MSSASSLLGRKEIGYPFQVGQSYGYLSAMTPRSVFCLPSPLDAKLADLESSAFNKLRSTATSIARSGARRFPFIRTA